MLAIHQPLFRAISSQHQRLSRQMAFAVCGSLVLWVSAKAQIPFYPVPLTMQTLVVLTIGVVAGWRLGAATVALYLIEGACGLPVFAGTPEKGIGLAYMLGPTGGYLIGYVAAAAACGWLAERGWDRNIATTALAMIAGNVLIYACGLLWLGTLLGWDKPIFAWGLTPFLLGDLLKIGLAAVLFPTTWQLLKLRDPGRR
jgi:biotin transport system substrate-specific component